MVLAKFTTKLHSKSFDGVTVDESVGRGHELQGYQRRIQVHDKAGDNEREE